jgi:hypothetical protein
MGAVPRARQAAPPPPQRARPRAARRVARRMQTRVLLRDPAGGVPLQVFADSETTAEELLRQAAALTGALTPRGALMVNGVRMHGAARVLPACGRPGVRVLQVPGSASCRVRCCVGVRPAPAAAADLRTLGFDGASFGPLFNESLARGRR